MERIGYTIGELCELAADDSETGEVAELTAGDIMHDQHEDLNMLLLLVSTKICTEKLLLVRSTEKFALPGLVRCVYGPVADCAAAPRRTHQRHRNLQD